jgi:hypothetical protein
MPAGAGGADGLHKRLLGADRLDHRMRAKPAGEFLDLGHALVAALFNNVATASIDPNPPH